MTKPDPLHASADTAAGADLTARLDEQLLVERVRAGDPLAFEIVFRRYRAELLGIAQGIVGSRTAAEDVVQDVFLAVWASREHWHIAASVRAYLRRAARNMALRHSSTAAVKRREPLATPGTRADGPALVDPAPSPEQDLEVAAIAGEVARVTAALPPRPREVYGLSRDQGLTTREIAARLGISPKTVELHLTRALTALRAALTLWRDG